MLFSTFALWLPLQMIFNGQTFQNLSRIREIIAVLIKYGFEDVVTNSTLRNFVSEKGRVSWQRQGQPVFEYTRWERVRMVCEELGPTFIKLAQVLSNRPDMLPAPLIAELEKLQDNVPAVPFEEIKATIERETGRKLEDVFQVFNEKPLATASIGQVHKARLHSGKEVVVKIQRPGVKDMVYRDLAILTDGVNRADRYLKKQGILNAMDLVRSFERSMHKELDYRTEARNLERFRSLYKDYKNFIIPAAFREYSTEKMMVMEFIGGCKISDVPQLKAWGLNPEKVAENGMNIYLTQIFEFGIFHADPHPGNVLVRRDGVICLLDFGMVGSLMRKDKYAFAGIFVGMAERDSAKMARNLKALSVDHGITDMRQLEYDLNELIEDFASLNVDEASIADTVERLQKIMFDHQIRVPGDVFLIFRAFAILEGIGKTIHPTFNTYDFIRPYGLKLMKEKYSPENIWKDVNQRFTSINAFLTSFPKDVREILDQTRNGKIHFEVELQGYGYLLKKLDSIANRMAITFLIVAFIIGSAITMTIDWGNRIGYIYGLPEISVYGLWCAGILMALLFYSIIRRRKYK
ncbi:MAG: AarF/ABC1/UbiB kinase family protein [Flavobacteriales bacterium]|jgi:ubiquinone biosynthesis protein|nr:AarF/ABC1/UbiB kinase family protein [Flavobacteriales bacterium]